MKPRRDKMRIPPPGEALAYARRLGFRRAFYRGTYIVSNKAVALSIFDCLTLRREDVNLALIDSAGDYERRFLKPGEIDRFAGDLDGVSERVAREAVARGDECYAVLDGERLANLGCFAPRPTPVLNDLMVHFDPTYWYMYGAFTPPAYRGRRLHALGVLGGSLELFDRGVSALVTVYERTNYASMVSALRMGWKPSGTLFRIGVGPWMYHGRTSQAYPTGMRLESRQVGGRV
jgi:hypothetical protein